MRAGAAAAPRGAPYRRTASGRALPWRLRCTLVHHAEYYRGLELAQQALRGAGAEPGARARAVHAAMAPAFADTPAAPQRACRAGCAHCCHLPVGVTFAEALALAAALRANAALAARVLAAARDTADLAWQELALLPCPLLTDGTCAAYELRPLPCRALASSDADACRAARDSRGAAPLDDVAFVRGLGAAAALAAADPPGTRELRAALAALLHGDAAGHAARFRAARGPS
jgi:Fe-S-cluster containining protein